MKINPMAAAGTLATQLPASPQPPAENAEEGELRKQFDQFVGETLFSQMLKSMRKTLGKPAYFHGGRAEDVFTQQLDQILAQEIGNSSAEKFSEPMFEQFMMRRR